MSRVYLDWNATAPLRREARDTMIAAMDAVGNPSSVHSEGRVVRAIVEKARGQLAEAFGASSSDIVFTSGATEAAALAMQGRELQSSEVEHDCVTSWTKTVLACNVDGIVEIRTPETTALQFANGETGVVQDQPKGIAVRDFVQGFGKLPVSFDWLDVEMGLLSAHKHGGPKGVGALVLKQGTETNAQIRGGGQEMGRRSGTENVVGIAGFGAAAEAAVRDLDNGVWQGVEKRRDTLEARLISEAPEIRIFGQNVKRLPNTSCFAVSGWTGETQVMQMDLAGFAVSAGAACSSGKVKASRVLTAMGVDERTASSAVRVSIGPETTEEELMRFADVWLVQYKRFVARAA